MLSCTTERDSEPDETKLEKNELIIFTIPYANSSWLLSVLYSCFWENNLTRDKLVVAATIDINNASTITSVKYLCLGTDNGGSPRGILPTTDTSNAEFRLA